MPYKNKQNLRRNFNKPEKKQNQHNNSVIDYSEFSKYTCNKYSKKNEDMMKKRN